MINEIRTTFLHRIYRVSLRVPTISFINIKPVNYNKQRPIVNNFLITRISCREILSTREQPRVNFNLRSNKIIFPPSPEDSSKSQELQSLSERATQWMCIILNKKKKKKEFSNISVIFLSNFDFRIFFFFFIMKKKRKIL